jgi:hypothetical protein
MAMRASAIAIAAVLAVPHPGAPAAGEGWTVDPAVLQPPAAAQATLTDVTALSGSDVWVVGSWSDLGGHVLAAHWDGTGWTEPPAPEPPTADSRISLAAVDAVAADDVWAVGTSSFSELPPLAAAAPLGTRPVALHYTGTAWTSVPVPSPTGTQTYLNDVDMVSAGDGWAVGSTLTTVPGTVAPTALRWQAGAWKPVTLPRFTGLDVELRAVHALSATDVWAVGDEVAGASEYSGLVLHWTGGRWQQVTLPALPGAMFNAVTADPSGAVWVAGDQCQTGGSGCRPLAMRYSLGSWQVVTPAAGATEFTAIVAPAADDVWFVGYAETFDLDDADAVEHWDGTTMTLDPTVPAPPLRPDGDPASALTGAAAAPGGGIWAVGWDMGATAPTTQVIHRD